MAAPVTLAASIPAEPVLGLMVAGVIVAVFGHMARSQRAAGIGIALVFLATALMVLGGFVAYEGGEQDPRPADSPFNQR